MKFFVLACFLATAAALEDTQDVMMAKAKFFKAFNAAKKGDLTYLQAPLIPVVAAKPYLMDSAAVIAAKPYLMDSAAVAAAKPYLMDSPAVAAAKPYLADSPAVAAAKPYMMDTAEVAAAKPYLMDSAAVAAAKPYLADTQEVATAKADFKKYFDAREMGIPATPGFLEPIQYAAPVVHAPITYTNPIYTTYAAPSVYNYALPAYTTTLGMLSQLMNVAAAK